MNLKYIYILLIISILNFNIEPLLAQEDTDSTKAENYEPRLSLNYLKNKEGIKILSCEIKIKKGKQILPLENAEIIFYAGNEPEIKLGPAKSDKKGIAKIEIKPGVEVPLDDSGAVRYMAEYKGEANSESASEEIFIKDISIEMILEEIDSVRTVTIKATKLGKNKEILPLGDFEINIYVKRLYSDLKVGSAYLDKETGEGSAEFPLIPGDSIGNVIVIARIDADENYGTIECSQVKNWGTAVEYKYNRIGPALWSQNAPTWMTITLYIFLAGVFYHLILIIRRLYKVKKLGQEARKENGLKQI